MEEQYLWDNPMADQSHGAGQGVVVYEAVEGPTMGGTQLQNVQAAYTSPATPVNQSPVGTTMESFKQDPSGAFVLDTPVMSIGEHDAQRAESFYEGSPDWWDKVVGGVGGFARDVNPLVGEDEQGQPTWDISFGALGDPDIPAAAEAVGGAVKSAVGAVVEPLSMTLMMLIMLMGERR